MENPEVAVDCRLSSEQSKRAAENQLNSLTTVGYLLEVYQAMDTFLGQYFHFCLELALET